MNEGDGEEMRDKKSGGDDDDEEEVFPPPRKNKRKTVSTANGEIHAIPFVTSDLIV